MKGKHSGIIHNHHIVGGGTSRKSDYTNIIPLCKRHHDEWHDIGRDTFAAKYNIDPEGAAAYVQAEWLKHSEVAA